MAISEELREAIRESGMSANAIARAAGVPQAAVSTFLNGKDIRLEKTADKLASYFNLRLVSEEKPAAKKPAKRRRKKA
jgi:DNA transposition AAA+ family ATPase